LFDGRNVWSPTEARKAGFTYYGIGRPWHPRGGRPPCAFARASRSWMVSREFSVWTI